MTFEKFKELLNAELALMDLVANVPEDDEISSDSIEENTIKPSEETMEREIKQSTIFALFCPYTRLELTGQMIAGEQPYPRKLRQVKMYRDYPSLLDAYANTRCPASQMIWAKNQEEFQQKLTIWNNRYDDKEWLKKNLYPYL